jgi:uridine phosphorylase
VPHLNPTAALAPRALLPADPGVALALAQVLLDGPRMFNHARGLWGYSGPAADGRPLTIQSTGIGGPSAAAVLGELADLGLREGVLLGTARALPGGAAAGELLTVGRALGRDGVSRRLAHPEPAAAPRLAGPAVVASGDLPWSAPEDLGAAAVAWDLACAPALAVAALRGMALGAVLLVEAGVDGGVLDAGEVEAGMERAGRAGAALLGVGLPAAAGAR